MALATGLITRHMQPRYVSFYTPDYRPEAIGLIETLRAHALVYSVREIPDRGRWAWNCARKPAFLQEVLREPGGRQPTVWLDADARVRQYPIFLSLLAEQTKTNPAGAADFAAHWKAPEHGNPAELLSGTLYFSGSPASLWLLDEWHQACQREPGVWDQKHLQRIVDAKPPWLTVATLPPAYTQIFDSMAHHGQPIIEHMQASRRLRRE